MGPPGRLTAIFVPPTSTSWEPEARPIPAATGHWMVGEFGSSSPDWWMACLTLSEQDGRCAGCGPQIVTFDCFIRAWFIELSSPGMKFPGASAVPTSCLSHTHPGTVVRLAAPRTASPNQGQTRQQNAPSTSESCCETTQRPDEACRQTTAEFLPYPGFDEPEERRRRGQVHRGLLHTAMFT